MNLVSPEGLGVTDEAIEMFEELIGVECFEGGGMDVDVVLLPEDKNYLVAPKSSSILSQY